MLETDTVQRADTPADTLMGHLVIVMPCKYLFMGKYKTYLIIFFFVPPLY